MEFHEAKHAKEALDCSGALLGALCLRASLLSMHICQCLHPDRLLHTGSLPLRVSPSKAPVRDEAPTR